ncbi:hypothetical protein BASA60_007558 [Batrachochytrium salamandrivorans]|nr:hypothetical protein BASA60_007558 [Batrachochytrium salamandrivorans]
MAWRALSKGKMDNMLENEQSFMLLNGLFTTFAIHNPESYCILEKNSDDTFEKSISFTASITTGIPELPTYVILDACHLRSKYGGVVMSAVAPMEKAVLFHLLKNMGSRKDLSEQDTIKAMRFILQENKRLEHIYYVPIQLNGRQLTFQQPDTVQ